MRFCGGRQTAVLEGTRVKWQANWWHGYPATAGQPRIALDPWFTSAGLRAAHEEQLANSQSLHRQSILDHIIKGSEPRWTIRLQYHLS
jgi:hypothetical protein